MVVLCVSFVKHVVCEIQAENQLSPEWTLMKQGQKGVPTMERWISEESSLAKGVVGIDPRVFSINTAKYGFTVLHAAMFDAAT